ncbi:9682_t:CDS:1, partial [Dentiscutata erythropus]
LFKNESNESKCDESDESEFDNESDKSNFAFRMFNVNRKSNNNDKSDQEYNDSLSYRKLSCISTSKILKFTKKQSKLIKSQNKLSWSIA